MITSRAAGLVEESRRPGDRHHLLEPFCLGDGHAPAEVRHPVVAPALVVHGRRRATARLDDQAPGEQPLDDAVERARF